MGEDKSKYKKDDAPQKKTESDVLGKIPEKFVLSPVEKEIFDKYGDIGLRAYKLIDGQRTAAEVMRETRLTEARLVEMLDFMDERGIIKLDYPKGQGASAPSSFSSQAQLSEDSMMRLAIEKYGESGKKLLGALKGWKSLDVLQKETGIDKKPLKRMLGFFEESGLVLSNYAQEFAKKEHIFSVDSALKTLYDKTSKQFGFDAVRLYLLIDGKTTIKKLRRLTPNAVKIIGVLVEDRAVVMDPYRIAPVVIKTNFTGATLPLIYDKGTNKTFERAMRYYGISLFTRAEEEFTALINKRNDAAYLVNRGSALYRQKKLAEAIADFTRAIELERENLKAFYNRGISYFEKEEYESAIADLTHAIQIKPDFAWAYYMRGFAIESIGKNIPDAIADFEKGAPTAAGLRGTTQASGSCQGKKEAH